MLYMKKHIAVIGANGQLGTDLCEVLKDDSTFSFTPLTHKDIEITDLSSIKNALEPINPTLVINTAAYNRVDDAEKNTETAFQINAFANKYLSSYCGEKDITLVAISTDYVFGLDDKRNAPYRETDCPGPVNAYGLSKLTGEYFVQYYLQKYFIVRTCGLFGKVGSSGKGGNFVELMLKLAREKGHVRVVDDQIVTPTHTLDLAKQILQLIKTDTFGLYHASAEGECSWYKFAKVIFTLTNTNVKIEPVSSDAFVTAAKRAKYSVLENEKLKQLGINVMRPWKDGLRDYLKEKGYIKN